VNSSSTSPIETPCIWHFARFPTSGDGIQHVEGLYANVYTGPRFQERAGPDLLK
jgi:hypothetical protein